MLDASSVQYFKLERESRLYVIPTLGAHKDQHLVLCLTVTYQKCPPLLSATSPVVFQLESVQK